MAIWILDEYEGLPLEYDALGFRASPGDLLSAVAAPDACWSLHADQEAAETVDRYALGVDPNYVEPTDGHVLAWSDAANNYVPTAVSGLNGPANTLSIGTVATGAPGSAAEASITGTAPDQTLHLTIPKGEKGDPGDPGAQGDPGPQGDAGAAGADAPTTVPSTSVTDNYTLVLADAGRAVEVDAATAKNVTVPANATVAFDVGTLIEVTQMGAGQVTLVPAVGVTLRYASSLLTRAQYSSLLLRKRATDEWIVGGDAQ